MTDRDFETLTRLATMDLLAALEKFSRSNHNRSIYAISLVLIAPGDAPSLCINREEDAPPFNGSERLDVYQDKYHGGLFKYTDEFVFSPDVLLLLKKFRSALKTLEDLQESEPQTSPASQQRIGFEWDRLYDGYYGSFFRVLNSLEGALDSIDRTPHCVQYLFLVDNDEQSRVQHFKETIAPPLFYTVFPAYR